MRRIFTSFILLAAGAFFAGAQNMYDALTFSENEYAGSARTIAMGNAFTALGGDLGSIGINPAGSAVAGYSQFTITPGLSLMTSTSQGTIPSGYSSPYCYDEVGEAMMSRFSMPNLGFILDFNTGRSRGLKNYTFGFASNVTKNFLDDVYAYGNQNKDFLTSYAGYIADQASGYNVEELMNYGYAPDEIALGWNSGLISYVNDDKDLYAGATEQFQQTKEGDYEFYTGGPLTQSYARQVKGSKYDYVINMAANFSDKLYIGANIGFTHFNYSYEDAQKEMPIDKENFPISTDDGDTYFKSLRHSYFYDAKGNGIYAKAGLIWKPTSFLRVGAAFQTPTITTIHESWQSYAETKFEDSNFDCNDYTPSYSADPYDLKSPGRINVGLAGVIGRFGLISVDYEMANYSKARFSETDYYSTYFDEVNSDISYYLTRQHALRVGLEAKPIDCLAIRAGFNIAGTPIRYEDEDGKLYTPKTNKKAYSFGIGYSSPKSFFVDLAVKALQYEDEYIYPYDDYMDVWSPEILTRRILWTAAVTFGWRF